jgi:hypothetical protein
MATFSHEGVTENRKTVRSEIDKQNSAESDVVINEADDGSGDQPSALKTRQQRGIRVREFGVGRKFLQERGDRGPEHPEARRNQNVHDEDVPDLDVVRCGQDGDRENDHSARSVEHHAEMATVFAIDDDSAEGQQEQRRDNLAYDEQSELLLGVSGLQDEPDDGGGIHAAAYHRDEVRDKQKSQSPDFENFPHAWIVTVKGVDLFQAERAKALPRLSYRRTRQAYVTREGFFVVNYLYAV